MLNKNLFEFPYPRGWPLFIDIFQNKKVFFLRIEYILHIFAIDSRIFIIVKKWIYLVHSTRIAFWSPHAIGRSGPVYVHQKDACFFKVANDASISLKGGKRIKR